MLLRRFAPLFRPTVRTSFVRKRNEYRLYTRPFTMSAPDVSAYYGAPPPAETKHVHHGAIIFCGHRWLSAYPDAFILFVRRTTRDFIMQQVMIRIADPVKSLDFYCKVLGMNLIWHADFPEWKFSLYFVGYCDASAIPADPAARRTFAMNTPGTVELTYNYGESGYHTGNTTKDPPVKGGFGHIGVTVPGNGVYDACQRFKDMGCEFQKSPNSGGMKGIAFVKDPDGYWIEIIPQGSDWERRDVDCCGVHIEKGGGYSGGGSGSKD